MKPQFPKGSWVISPPVEGVQRKGIVIGQKGEDRVRVSWRAVLRPGSPWRRLRPSHVSNATLQELELLEP